MKKKFQVIRGQKMQDQSILKLFKKLEILMYSEHSAMLHWSFKAPSCKIA